MDNPPLSPSPTSHVHYVKQSGDDATAAPVLGSALTDVWNPPADIHAYADLYVAIDEVRPDEGDWIVIEYAGEWAMALVIEGECPVIIEPPPPVPVFSSIITSDGKYELIIKPIGDA